MATGSPTTISISDFLLNLPPLTRGQTSTEKYMTMIEHWRAQAAEKKAANLQKHAGTIQALQVLQQSGKFSHSRLTEMLHTLLGPVTPEELRDVTGHLGL
jgi:hypothetical protein